MDTKELETKEYVKDLSNRNWDFYKLASQRLDYLVVSVSGAGIYICLELMKYLNDNGICITNCIKLSGLSFAVAIILNFCSQFFVFNAYHNLLKIEQIHKLSLEDDAKWCFVKFGRYSKLASISIFASIGFMFIGIIGLIYALYTTF